MKFLLVLVLLFSGNAKAQKLSPEDIVVKTWMASGKAAVAAAFLDASIQISDPREPQERIRLLLLSAIAHADTGDFSAAYRRTQQAEELLKWSGFQDPLTYNEKARNRIRASVDLVLHDIRRAEGRLRDGGRL